MYKILVLFLVASRHAVTTALQSPRPQQQSSSSLPPPAAVSHLSVSRRDIVFTQGRAIVAAATVASSVLLPALPVIVQAAQPPIGLKLNDTPCGLQWADAKVGSGQPLRIGQTVAIDYSMASTAGRFPIIYSTKDSGSPYRWTLGDGSTIAGIEMAILGNDQQGIPPMIPGSIRRVIIPEALGYITLKQNNNGKCSPEDSIGPIPPKENVMGSGAYQRWYQFYCNPRIPYQPDLVLDIKLYGKR